MTVCHIESRVQGSTLLIGLKSGGQGNRIAASTLAALVEVLAVLDEHIACVVLHGESDAFCEGLAREAWPADLQSAQGAVALAVHELRRCTVPTIAAVEGVASGVGCALALACDELVLGERAQLRARQPDLPHVDEQVVRAAAAALGRHGAWPFLVHDLPVSASAWCGRLGIGEAVAAGGALDCALQRAQRLAQIPRQRIARIKEMLGTEDA